MRKKIFMIFMAATLCVSTALMSACEPRRRDPDAPSVNYEGEMLFNGFDTVDDLYRVSQLYDWPGYQTQGKLQIVGADNFIPPVEPEEPEPPDPDAAAAAAAVDAMIAALPPVEEVSLLEDMDAVARARRAYGDLSAEAKELVQNLSKLKALEASEALEGYYTLADLGIADVSGAPEWASYSGNLRDPMSGTVVFKASGLDGTQGGFFYISLFQDPTENAGQSNDGIAIWMMTAAALPQNSTNTNINFNEGKSISADQTYTFFVGYEVAEDYSAMGLSIRVEDEAGEVIVEGAQNVTSFTLTNFGSQTVESWLKDHDNVLGHQTFWLGTGASTNVTLQSCWTGTLASDFEEPLAGAAAAVDDMIAALPSLEEVTLADKEAVNAARRAYGDLSMEAKELVENLDKLKALEQSEALAGYYTLADFGVADVAGAPEWASYSGKLRDPMSGTVVFRVSGIAAGTDGAFYISLFQDPTANAGEAGDGISVWVRTNNNTLLPQNSTNEGIGFSEGRTITPDQTYTFFVGYEVAADYSSLTLNLRIEDEAGEVIVDGTQNITSFTLSNFGAQTVENWLKDHENAAGHQTFWVGTGASTNVTIRSCWTPVSESDFEEPESGEPVEEPDLPERDPADLSPRQGEGALRAAYEVGPYTQLLARFDRSALPDLPVANLGGFSVKIYNDSPAERRVTLSLMQEQNLTVEVDGGTFTLAPYAWTECSVKLDPIIVEYLADTLVGLNIQFNTTTEAVYYLDDLRVNFDQEITDEILQTMAQVEELVADLEPLDGRIITQDDKEMLEALYTRYLALPQAYRFTVSNAGLLTDAIADYYGTLVGLDTERQTVLYFDEIMGLTQLNEFTGGTASFTTEEHAEGENGALRLDFNGSASWVTVPLLPADHEGGYDEVQVWVKNDSDSKRAFQINWNVAASAEGENVTGGNILAGYVLPANSGWIKLTYRNLTSYTEFNIVSLNEGNTAVNTVDTLYVGKVVLVSNAPAVVAQIEALPEYTAGYAHADAVADARAAYNALSALTKTDVANLDKLIGLEAAIWREGFAALPESPEDIAEYSDELKAAIDALRAAYDQLDPAVQAAVADDEALLCEFEAKIAEFRVEYVNSLLSAISEKDFYRAADVKAIRAAKAAYDELTAEEQSMIAEADLQKLNACLADIRSYYTLTDLGNASYGQNLARENFDYPIGGWVGAGAKLADPMRGTVVFNATGIDVIDGALYITLFHDRSLGEGESTAGVTTMLRNTNGQGSLHFITLPGSPSQSFEADENEQPKVLSPTETYTFYVTYEVAEDYSKLTFSVRIEDQSGALIVEAEQEVTSFTAAGISETQTVASWLEGNEGRQTFYVNSGNSSALKLSAAW